MTVLEVIFLIWGLVSACSVLPLTLFNNFFTGLVVAIFWPFFILKHAYRVWSEF